MTVTYLYCFDLNCVNQNWLKHSLINMQTSNYHFLEQPVLKKKNPLQPFVKGNWKKQHDNEQGLNLFEMNSVPEKQWYPFWDQRCTVKQKLFKLQLHPNT